jgi:hypothetical protein
VKDALAATPLRDGGAFTGEAVYVPVASMIFSIEAVVKIALR